MSDRQRTDVMKWCHTARASVEHNTADVASLAELSDRVRDIIGESPVSFTSDRYYVFFGDEPVQFCNGCVAAENVAKYCADGNPYAHGTFLGFVTPRDFLFDETDIDTSDMPTVYAMLYSEDADMTHLVDVESIQTVR